MVQLYQSLELTIQGTGRNRFRGSLPSKSIKKAGAKTIILAAASLYLEPNRKVLQQMVYRGEWGDP